MKVFFDTNVLIDTLVKRDPHYTDSARLWTLAEARRIEGIASAVSLTNIYYITRRLASKTVAMDALRVIQASFSITPCDQHIIGRAIDADFNDFEDAVQYHSALAAGADCLVTRNVNHFPKPSMDVLTPTAFLAAHSFR